MTRNRGRSLLVFAGAGLAVGGAAGVLLMLIGFGVRLDVWVLVGLVTGVTIWFFRDVFDSGQEPPQQEPRVPLQPMWSIHVDRRTRTLESRLRGAQRRNATTVSALQRTIADIAHRSGEPLPPATARYLASDPRPLTRAQLRTIIRELTQR